MLQASSDDIVIKQGYRQELTYIKMKEKVFKKRNLNYVASFFDS